MRKLTKTLALTFVFIAGLTAVSALYAQDSKRSPGSTMKHGMMDDGKTDGGGMMGMMMQMTKMMDHCNNMMGSGGNRPNDQWRKDAPTEPERKG